MSLFSSMFRLSAGFVGCSLLVLGGCSESVTQHDVDQARKKADQEHQAAVNVRTQSPDDASAIHKQDQKATEADQKLRDTEAKAQATTARDSYVAKVDNQLKLADQRIDDMKKAASSQSGTQKDDTDRKVSDLQTKRSRVSENLSKLKMADVLQWQTYEPAVQQALDDLNRS